jgi:hypothetical protein
MKGLDAPIAHGEIDHVADHADVAAAAAARLQYSQK